MRILVNGKEKVVDQDSLTHEELCALAGTSEEAVITYRSLRPDGHKRGTLWLNEKGQTVQLEDGLSFSVMVAGSA